MSVFLDRTRDARNVLPGEAAAATTDPENWVEVLRKMNVVGADIAESRLANCHKTHLTLPPDSPLLVNASDTYSRAMEAYRMLRTRLMRAQAAQGLRTLLFSSTVSKEGKTLTTLNLARAYLVLRDQRVLIIDGDLRTRAMSQFFSQNSGLGLSDALVGDAKFADVILATDKPNLFFVSAGKNPAPPPELYASQRWKDFLGWCSECFTVILVDSPPVFPLSDFDLMSAACDGVVLIVRAQCTNRDLLQKAAAQVDSRKLLGIVYNASQSESRKSEYNKPPLPSDSHQ
jgi:capsular exopolysaccharide synthesis family protein